MEEGQGVHAAKQCGFCCSCVFITSDSHLSGLGSYTFFLFDFLSIYNVRVVAVTTQVVMRACDALQIELQ